MQRVEDMSAKQIVTKQLKYSFITAEDAGVERESIYVSVALLQHKESCNICCCRLHPCPVLFSLTHISASFPPTPGFSTRLTKCQGNVTLIILLWARSEASLVLLKVFGSFLNLIWVSRKSDCLCLLVQRCLTTRRTPPPHQLHLRNVISDLVVR